METANSAVLSAQQELSSAQSNIMAYERQIADLTSQVNATPILAAQARTQAMSTEAGLGEKLQQIKAGNVYSLTSPIKGKVMALPVNVGQTVQAGGTISVVIPEGSQLQAELFVPSRAAGFISVGKDVTLQYQAFPYQKFGSAHGKVVSVSRTVLAPAEVTIAGLSLQEPVFRVHVALDRDYVNAYGLKTPLQPGMLLNADIIIDRRSLLEWLLDPLYAVGKRA